MVLLYPYFYVISVLFNPLSYQRRYDLYRDFEKHIQSFGVQLVTVELAFNNQSFQVTNSTNKNHIQLRTSDYLWYKENLINIAINHLPPECQYVAWIDADVEFMNNNLIQDTIRALDNYRIVQLFEYANFLGPENQTLRIDTGFGWSYATDQPYYSKSYIPFKLLHSDHFEEVTGTKGQKSCKAKDNIDRITDLLWPTRSEYKNLHERSGKENDQNKQIGSFNLYSGRPPCCIIISNEQKKKFGTNNLYGGDSRPCCTIIAEKEKKIKLNPKYKDVEEFVYWHPGYAWAAKKSTLINIDGLFDKAILGASDRIMSFGFIGKIEDGLPANMSQAFKAEALRWGDNVSKEVKNKVGFVNGTLNHFWHGSRTDRQYVSRQRILQASPVPFEPSKHLYYDENNLLRFSSFNKEYYSSSIKEYFNNRNEDNKAFIGRLI